MGRDLVSIFVSATIATLNPTLLGGGRGHVGAPASEPIDAGVAARAYTTSIAVGLALVLGVCDAAAVRTSRHTLGPGGDVLIGAALLAIAFALATDRDAPPRGWRARRKRRKAAEPR